MNPFWSNIFRKPGYEGTLAYFLGTIAMFSELSPSELKILENLVHLRNYDLGETVFAEGDIGSGMYIIRSGRVRIDLKDDQGVEHPQAELETADFFGEMALSLPKQRIVTATTMEPTVLVGLFRADVNDSVRKHPALAAKMLLGLNKVLSERLQQAALRHREHLHLPQEPVQTDPT